MAACAFLINLPSDLPVFVHFVLRGLQKTTQFFNYYFCFWLLNLFITFEIKYCSFVKNNIRTWMPWKAGEGTSGRAITCMYVCILQVIAYVIQDTGAGFMYRPVCCRWTAKGHTFFLIRLYRCWSRIAKRTSLMHASARAFGSAIPSLQKGKRR